MKIEPVTSYDEKALKCWDHYCESCNHDPKDYRAKRMYLTAWRTGFLSVGEVEKAVFKLIAQTANIVKEEEEL